MICAFDIDGTVDANPVGFESLMAGMKANGHQIVILTGCSAKVPTQQDAQEKAAYLAKLGMGNCWDKLVVFGDPPHKAKAKWVKKNMHTDDLLFENSIQNAQLCTPYTTVCLVWNDKSD